MTLIVTLSDDTLWQKAIENSVGTVISKLQDANSNKSTLIVKEPVELEELDAFAADHTQIIVAYLPPEVAISRQVNENCGIAVAFEQWRQQAIELTTFFRVNRRKVKLINLHDLARLEKAGTESLTELGWQLGKVSHLCPQTLERIAVAYTIQQDEQLKHVSALLTACSISLTDAPEILNVSEALNYSIEAKDAIASRHDEALNQQARDYENRLDEKSTLIQKLQDENEAFKSEVADFNKRFETEKAAWHEREDKNKVAFNRIVEQLHASQKELKTQINTNNQVVAQLHATQKELEGQTNTNNQVVTQLHATQKELEGQTNSNNQVVAQLHATQKELEGQTNSNNLLVEKLHATQKELESQTDSYEQVVEQLHVTQKELESKVILFDQTAEQLHKVQKELEDQVQHNHEIIEKLRSNKNELERQIKLKHKAVEQSELQKVELDGRIAHLEKLHEREKRKLQKKALQKSGEAATLCYQLSQAEKQLELIQQSFVWKASAPARALSSILSRDTRYKSRIQEDISLINSSKYFDAAWYLNTYQDVNSSNLDPAEHYLLHGAEEGRRPSLDFDSQWYLKNYPDVAESGTNPLIHFIRFGIHEGRSPSPKLLENRAQEE